MGEIFLNRMAGFQARIKWSNGPESAKSCPSLNIERRHDDGSRYYAVNCRAEPLHSELSRYNV